jgi:hypothetical protein
LELLLLLCPPQLLPQPWLLLLSQSCLLQALLVLLLLVLVLVLAQVLMLMLLVVLVLV